MRKESEELSFLYENLLINEISKKFIDEVKGAITDGNLPFQNIFNDKLRLVVPISGTETYKEILNAVSNIKDFYRFDPQKKEVIRKIKLDPKYGGGEKEQKINLGKAIYSLKISDDLKKKYLNWFANYESNIPEMDDLQKYSVVISRSPIDVLRMSDISGVTSCHSQGGSYFHCAIQEAKSGGAVAYVVKTADIKKLSEDDLQNEEIFEDQSRNIKGISVLSRLRIRRYKIKEENSDIGVSETRTYGNKIPGFYNTVKNFLNEKQASDTNQIYNLYKNKKIIRTGGTYTDSSDSELFNKMFNTDIFHGSTPHEETDESSSRFAQFEEELQGFQNRFEFTHSHAQFNVDYLDGEDEVYYTAWGYIEIDLGDYQVIDGFREFDENYAITQLKNYDPSSQNSWQRQLPYNFKDNQDAANKYKKFLEEFEKYDKSDLSSYGMLESIHIKSNYNRATESSTKNNSVLQLGVSFEEGGSSFNTDDYWEFLKVIESIDNDYDSVRKALLKALINNGLVKSTKEGTDISDYKSISNSEEFIENLKNFEYDDTDEEASTQIYLGNFNIPRPNNVYTANASMIFGEALEKYLNLYYKPTQKTNTNQLTFDKFFENHYTATLQDKYNITKIKADYTSGFGKETEFGMKLTITFENLNNKTADILKFIDDHYDDITNIAKLLFLKLAKIENQDTKRLQQVYSKVL